MSTGQLYTTACLLSGIMGVVRKRLVKRVYTYKDISFIQKRAHMHRLIIVSIELAVTVLDLFVHDLSTFSWKVKISCKIIDMSHAWSKYFWYDRILR